MSGASQACLTGTMGAAFLTDHFPDASKAIWDFDGVYCNIQAHPWRPLCRQALISHLNLMETGCARISWAECFGGILLLTLQYVYHVCAGYPREHVASDAWIDGT